MSGQHRAPRDPVWVRAFTQGENMAGTPTEPLPVDTSKTEPKVKVSALVQYLGGLVLLAIITGAMDGNLIAFLPDWASTVLVPVLPTAAAWLAAYNTRHQYRAPETVR